MTGGRTAGEAIEVLEEGWRAQHEREVETWNEQTQRHRWEEETRGREQTTSQADEHPLEKAARDWRPSPSFIDIKPARHVLKRLEKKEFVELWHFAAEGRRTAAAETADSEEGTFGLVGTSKGFVFQTVGVSSTSSKVMRDENLSWEQLSEGKTRMLSCMSACGCDEECTQLAMLYLRLDTHPFRSHPNGREAIFHYRDRVRRDWVEAVKAGDPFRIVDINYGMSREFRDDIRNEVQTRNNVSGPQD